MSILRTIRDNSIDLSNSSDFACLLELMVPLTDQPEYACLPELFSIIGPEKLILLSKYAGGSEIKIPTITEITEAIEILQWFYDIHITKKKKLTHCPFKYRSRILKIEEIYKDVSSS